MKRQTTDKGLYLSGKAWEIRAAMRLFRTSQLTLERYLAVVNGKSQPIPFTTDRGTERCKLVVINRRSNSHVE